MVFHLHNHGVNSWRLLSIRSPLKGSAVSNPARGCRQRRPTPSDRLRAVLNHHRFRLPWEANRDALDLGDRAEAKVASSAPWPPCPLAPET